ncbi:MAG TPA: glycoside hydrolase family 3 C-terminal domain-containing protein [Bryobacteraceae bacterium]|jgi:beta-glucosidase
MRPIFVMLLAAGLSDAQAQNIYRDPAQPIEARISDLISQMTLEEKAAELNHLSSRNDRLRIPAWGGWNQTLHGVWSKQPTTLFPTAIGMAATWDPELIKTITDAMSDEARALYNIGADGPRSKHGLVYRSPVINISRDPRWGRIQECFGEDPYLAGRIAVGYVQGLQGAGKYLKVAATVKHFAVNNVETNRHALSAAVPERILMEYWLPHWKAAIVEGRAQSVMASYNQLNGVPNIANPYLLTDVLRGLWHFDGFVVSDLGGVNSSLVQGAHITDNLDVAVSRAISAGCDLDDNFYEQALPRAVRSGLVSEKVVDEALRRVLRVAFRLGVFDPPEMVPYSKITADVIDSQAHRELALKTALESIVLLKNANRFLPLNKSAVRSVAVIGPHADQFETGNYFGAKPRIVSPLEGLRAKLETNAKVEYAAGCDVVEPAKPEEIEQAAELARRSDVAIVFLGTNLKVEAEGRDRKSLDLPGSQEQLLEAVYKANPKTIAVIMSGGPVSVQWASRNVPAILLSWYPGEEAGAALASVLFGDYDPAGRLPYTVYNSVDDVPPQDEYDITKGYTYLYFEGKPQFAFGHGLSYTTFRYSGLQVTPARAGNNESVKVSLTVQNTGDRAGEEVAQLYIHEVAAAVKRPTKELRGFQRIGLKPNERRTVTFTLPIADLAYYDAGARKFTVKPGAFDIMVGSSSDDIRLRAKLQVKE